MKRLLVALVVIVAGGVLLAGCNRTDKAASSGGAAAPFDTRRVTAGAVEVKMTPKRIDGSGAAFEVILDTHSVELDLDVAKGARLDVDGTAWTGASWSGDGPGGHHREGTLSFDPGGPATGKALLTIEGLPGPVEANWDLGVGS